MIVHAYKTEWTFTEAVSVDLIQNLLIFYIISGRCFYHDLIFGNNKNQFSILFPNPQFAKLIVYQYWLIVM